MLFTVTNILSVISSVYECRCTLVFINYVILDAKVKRYILIELIIISSAFILLNFLPLS